jgi:hypothetical protein
MTEIQKSAELLRHELASIDLSDILKLLKERLSDEEAQEIAGTVEIFYRTIFEKRIKLLIQRQLEFIGTEAVNDSQLQFARGTVNGFFLIDEWFKEQVHRSLSRNKSHISKNDGEAIKTIGNI